MVAIRRVNQPHVERHLAGEVCCIQHFRHLLLLGGTVDTYQLEVARLGKLHQRVDKLLLVGGRLDVHQSGILLRALYAYVLRRAVVGDFIIELRQLRHLDEVAEALLQHYLVR